MHVLVTTDTVGGVWTYTRELVSGLVRRGVRVSLVSFGDIPDSEQTAWMDGLPRLDYRPTAFRLEWMQEAQQDLPASRDYLARVVQEVKPDLLHLSQFAYGDLPIDVPRIVVVHSDVVSWWQAVHGEEPPDTEWMRWYRAVVSRGLAGATAVVAPSRCMLEEIGGCHRHRSNGRVIYNGRNPALFNPHCTKDELVVSVGRLWDAGKQVSLLAQGRHKISVFIAGAEHHPEMALRATMTLGDQHSVLFRGPLTERQLGLLLSRASIYAATSRYEPFGLAPLEAALSRCALVANDIPSFREIWGDTALYFRRNDAQDLADTIDRLRAEPELRATYANLAYHHARARFNSERMVNEYLNLYASLAPVEAAVA